MFKLKAVIAAIAKSVTDIMEKLEDADAVIVDIVPPDHQRDSQKLYPILVNLTQDKGISPLAKGVPNE